MKKDLDISDSMERFELARRVLTVAGIVFWLLCLMSVEDKVFWAIGIMLPCIPLISNRTIVLYTYMICTVAYVIVGITVLHIIWQFIPHLACCVCLIGDSLISGAIKEVDKFEQDIKKRL